MSAIEVMVDASQPARALGAAAVGTALVAHALLLDRLRRAEARAPWWFGYARDGVNAAALLMVLAGLLGLGLPGPSALLGAVATTLGVYILDWAAARALGARWSPVLLLGAGAGWMAVLVLGLDRVADTLARLVTLGVGSRT